MTPAAHFHKAVGVCCFSALSRERLSSFCRTVPVTFRRRLSSEKERLLRVSRLRTTADTCCLPVLSGGERRIIPTGGCSCSPSCACLPKRGCPFAGGTFLPAATPIFPVVSVPSKPAGILSAYEQASDRKAASFILFHPVSCICIYKYSRLRTAHRKKWISRRIRPVRNYVSRLPACTRIP